MNLRLFQELVELNLAFEQVLQRLQRMEKMRLFHGDIIRYARADVESARVDANREFFDNFDDIVENDAVWAYKFQREYNRKIKDPDDIYLELKDSEERRKKKGLPPRLVILPGDSRAAHRVANAERLAGVAGAGDGEDPGNAGRVGIGRCGRGRNGGTPLGPARPARAVRRHVDRQPLVSLLHAA